MVKSYNEFINEDLQILDKNQKRLSHTKYLNGYYKAILKKILKIILKKEILYILQFVNLMKDLDVIYFLYSTNIQKHKA